MVIAIMLIALGALNIGALRYGADSRETGDWRGRPSDARDRGESNFR